MSRDKPDYSHLAPKGQIWVAWKSHTKIRYNDLASTGTPVDAGSFFFTHIDLKKLNFFPIPFPSTLSQIPILPHYILVKSKKTGGKKGKIWEKILKRLWREIRGNSRGPIQIPSISHHPRCFSQKNGGKILRNERKNPSRKFLQTYNKMGRYMLWNLKCEMWGECENLPLGGC